MSKVFAFKPARRRERKFSPAPENIQPPAGPFMTLRTTYYYRSKLDGREFNKIDKALSPSTCASDIVPAGNALIERIRRTIWYVASCISRYWDDDTITSPRSLSPRETNHRTTGKAGFLWLILCELTEIITKTLKDKCGKCLC